MQIARFASGVAQCEGRAPYGQSAVRSSFVTPRGPKGETAHPLKINMSGAFRRRPNTSDIGPSNCEPLGALSDRSDQLAVGSQRGWIASLSAVCIFKAPRTKQEHHHDRRNSLVPHIA